MPEETLQTSGLSPNSNGPIFERPIAELENRVKELEALASSTRMDLSGEIKLLRDRLQVKLQETYSQLTPWERVAVARHPERPSTTSYITQICDEFFELHGDGFFGDDRAIVTGLGRIGTQRLLIVGHRKGQTTRERIACNFGCAHPEGYRKALRKMKLAEKLGIPILCLINTPGAYPGIGAEERGQARAIAENIYEMFEIRVPIVCVVIGEGGSGGALGIGVGDKVAVLQHAYYSVISPEGCAAILWKSGERAPEAASALKLTAEDLIELGIIDEIIPEPLGGAHRNPAAMIATFKEKLLGYFQELSKVPIESLLDRRYQKFRNVGIPGNATKTRS